MGDNRDSDWKHQWIWEASWFWIFTAFVIAVVYILQPNQNSDLLTQMQEILDETLNELPTGESFHEGEFPDMADQFELHEFGGISR